MKYTFLDLFLPLITQPVKGIMHWYGYWVRPSYSYFFGYYFGGWPK